MAKNKIYVVISLDVEEEGLFSGHYNSRDASVENVAFLPRLEPISREYGFPLTLLCAHSVFSSPKALPVLEHMRDQLDAEIGAHLHHWSTPPFEEAPNDNLAPERTHKMAPRLLERKLAALLRAGQDFQGAPLASFRMGRWDLKSRILPLLAAEGITVDSSICPLRSFAGGASHFLAPADPYWHEMASGNAILEAPITQIPVFPILARAWHKVWSGNDRLLDSFHFFGAMSANPFWHNERVMRMAAKAHVKRGGRILNLFWHSSEIMPGGSPHVPDQPSADKMLAKIFSFCAWLGNEYDARGITMNQLPGLARECDFARVKFAADRDW